MKLIEMGGYFFEKQYNKFQNIAHLRSFLILKFLI